MSLLRRAILAAVALLLVTAAVPAVAIDSDVATWTQEDYPPLPGFGSAVWSVSGDTAWMETNAQPTLFYSDFEVGSSYYVEADLMSSGGDDDFIGFALGFQPGDTTKTTAAYLLVDWKRRTQSTNFSGTSCTPGSGAALGLAVSHVFGTPTADEMWGHVNFDATCSPLTSGVIEMARAANLGSTGWVQNQWYSFRFEMNDDRLAVYVDGVLEIDVYVAGLFTPGRFAFYDFSQADAFFRFVDAGPLASENTPPVANDDSVSSPEDTAVVIDVAANDVDAEGSLDLSTVTVLEGPVHGTVTSHGDGTVTYTPDPDFYGADSFVYEICDDGGLCDTATVVINVEPVNDPPVADAGGPYVANEGDTVAFDGTASSDPDADPLTYLWDLNFDGVLESAGATPTWTYGDNYSETVMLTVTDPSGESDTDTATVEIANVAPSLGPISGPTTPVRVGTDVTVTAAYTDPGFLDTHTADCDWGDGGSHPPGVAAAGTASCTYRYSMAGIYAVQMTVTDDDGGTATRTFRLVEVYDPNAGFITGGGWIQSGGGAYQPDDSLTGKASFGFVVKYKKGATTPTGNTEFQFRNGDLNFHASHYEVLIVTGPHAAYFRGVGTINGSGRYGFSVWVGDGDPDTIRIRIWEEGAATVIYDNGGAQALGGGSIVIHTK
jgi:hypothetical protein